MRHSVDMEIFMMDGNSRGKVEPGEQPEQAIIREIKEELESTVSIIKFLCTVEHDYPKFHLIMHCYMCRLEEGNLHLVEHEAARWLLPEQIDSEAGYRRILRLSMH